MFMVGLLSWWYGRGWFDQVRLAGRRFRGTLAFFSVGQLLETLFSPFRQISATPGIGGAPTSLIGRFFDVLLSRCIGAIVRSLTILFGCLAIVLQAGYEAVIIVFWPLLPLFPVVGLVLFAIGWVPEWM